MVRVFLTAILLTALVACSSKKEGDLGPQPLQPYKASIGLKKAWQVDLGTGLGKRFSQLTAVLSNDKILALANTSEIQARDAETSKLIWRNKTKLRIAGGIGLGLQQFYVGTLDGTLEAFATDTGKHLWSAQAHSEVIGVPAENAGLVVARSIDGRIYGFDQSSGEQLWIFKSTVPVLTLRGLSGVVFFDDLVIAGLANGKIVALDRRTGQMRWERRVAIGQGRSEIERIADLDTTPLLMDGKVLALSYQGRLLAMDASNGRPQWQAQAPSYQNFDSGFGNIYIVTKTSDLIAISSSDGREKWRQSLLSRRGLSAPIVLGNYIAVGDYEGYLHVFSQVDGELVSRRRMGRYAINANLLADSRYIYAQNHTGTLAAYYLDKEFTQLHSVGNIPARSEVMRKTGMHPEYKNRAK